MGRALGVESSDGLYHVINRGNYRSYIFDTEGMRWLQPKKEQLAMGAKIHTVEIMSIPDVKKMTIKERLITMEQICNTLCHEETEPNSPSWHETVLSERKKAMASPEAKFLTIEQLRERYS